ncbi:MAG TPA: HlyD family secretion protein [Acetobacteraceae bacterium]|nr:HlyD family secretion protein [Acetobacteraceae bacterium]
MSQSESPRGDERRRRRHRVALAIILVVIAFAAWEILTRVVAYTSDAYVRSDLVAIAPEVTGRIIAVPIHDNQTVHRGDLLVLIDPEPFRLALDAAEAAVREATAQASADRDATTVATAEKQSADAALLFAEETQKRVQTLTAQDYNSMAQLDAANDALRRAEAADSAASAAQARAREMLATDAAATARAEAALALATWRLGKTHVRAPVDGTINNLTIHVGDLARAEQPLIGIIDAHAWRIIANYPEYQLPRLTVGGTAWVWLDSHPWHFYRARIVGIARGISRTPEPQGLLPYVAPTTDWIRLQRRFPVTLHLVDPPPGLTLFMGADARTVIFP